MNKYKHREPIQTQAVVEDISNSAEFTEDREKGKPLTQAFSRSAFALALLETYDSGHRTKEGDRLNVAGHVGQFVDALKELDDAYEVSSDIETIQSIKRKLIPFNHAVKDLIDHDPMAGFREVNRFISEVYVTTHRGDLAAMTDEARAAEIDFVRQNTLKRLSGMRHEIAAQQLFGHLGYDVDAEVSIEDELNGIDMVVTDQDNAKLPIDIKANHRDALETRAKDKHNRLIIWSTVPHADFDGHFRLSPEVVALRADDIAKELAVERQRTGK